MTEETEQDTLSSENDRKLHRAVTAEEDSLHEAPSLTEDGPGVRRDLDAGPTEDTMLTAAQIADSQGLTSRLRNLDVDTEPDRP